MAHEITFQELIDKVKDDLFSPYQGTTEKGKVAYPVFFVDRVELEITVDLSYDAEAGVKVSIPQLIEGSLAGEQGKATGHRMKITLVPILTSDQMRNLLKRDSRLMKGVEEAHLMAMRKGVDLLGKD